MGIAPNIGIRVRNHSHGQRSQNPLGTVLFLGAVKPHLVVPELCFKCTYEKKVKCGLDWMNDKNKIYVLSYDFCL